MLLEKRGSPAVFPTCAHNLIEGLHLCLVFLAVHASEEMGGDVDFLMTVEEAQVLFPKDREIRTDKRTQLGVFVQRLGCLTASDGTCCNP